MSKLSKEKESNKEYFLELEKNAFDNLTVEDIQEMNDTIENEKKDYFQNKKQKETLQNNIIILIALIVLGLFSGIVGQIACIPLTIALGYFIFKILKTSRKMFLNKTIASELEFTKKEYLKKY